MTEKLYYKDQYLKNFAATVLTCEKCDGGYLVTLDKTAFFPTGGGQSCDTGYIGECRVLEVTEQGREIFHRVCAPIEKGSTVTCNLDFDLRFERMQMHTAEHIVSGVIHSRFGYDNVGFHLGDDAVTLDVNGVLTREQLDWVEDTVNTAVFSNIPVECRFISETEINTLSYRSKLDLTEGVRVVTVEGYDSCACCAPHVATTGEIGIVKLLDFIKYKGGTRIRLLAGRRALLDYRIKFSTLLDISNTLSAPIHECDVEVKRVLDEMNAKDRRIKTLTLSIASGIAASVEATDGNAVVFAEGCSHDELRFIANATEGRVGGILVCLSGEENDYKYVISSATVDLRQKIKEINAALSGRGGGRAEMAQGSFYCPLDAIKEYFSLK